MRTVIPKFSFASFFSLRSLFPFVGSGSEKGMLLFACWTFFTYTVFSGALRKWYFGEGQVSNIIFFIQLLGYFVFFLLVVSTKLPDRFRPPALFIIYVVYLVIAGFNPKNATIYHGFFGIIIHLGFWVGLIAYLRKRRYFDLEKLVPFFIVILAAEILLASLQYALPVDHILNVKALGGATDALVGDAVRVSGTFSFLAGFHSMIIFYAFLIWFMLILDYPFVLTATVFGLGLYGALMSGSRGATATYLLVSVVGLVHTGYLIRRFTSVVVTFGVLSVLILYLGEGLIRTFDTAYDNFSARVNWGQVSGEQDQRIGFYYDEIINYRGNYPIYGIGLGSTYQGANSLFGESIYAKEYGGYEYELGRIILEGGFILFFLRLILLFVMFRYTYIPLLGKLVILIAFLNNPVVFNVYSGIFIMLGIILVDRAYYLKSGNRNRSRLVRT